MYTKAIWKFVIDINIFNIPFSLIFGLIFNPLWALVIFSSFGILIGYLGHSAFKKHEYYTYYNLGFTKMNLLKKVWLLNVAITLFIFLIVIIFG